jgi:hypothetical protein
MAQYARPEADTNISNWKDDASGTTDIYQAIDDVTADELAWIRGPVSGSNNYRCRLSDVITPDTGTRTIRLRLRVQSGSNNIDVTLYSDDGSTSVQSWTAQSVSSTSFSNMDLTVTNAISDYTDLHLEVDQNADTGRVIITQAYLEVPDAAAASSPYAPTGLSATGSGDSMALAWNDTNSGTTQYRVYGKRSTDSQYSWLPDTADGATSYVDEWLISDTSYDYRVTAWDGTNESEYASATGTTGTVLRVSGSFL